MPYYLSYIEVNRHAAMMLSYQSALEEPTKVVAEIGFGDFDGLNTTSLYFKTLQGYVHEEDNVSRALYSSASVKHQTFEISTTEMERFFTIINRDKHLNINEYVEGAFSKINYNAFLKIRGMITDEGLLRKLQSGTQDNYRYLYLTSKEASQLKTALSAHPELLKSVENSLSKPFTVSGPNYQLLSANCKTYALGVFKELGLVEATTLSNFIVQRPGTRQDKLH